MGNNLHAYPHSQVHMLSRLGNSFCLTLLSACIFFVSLAASAISVYDELPEKGYDTEIDKQIRNEVALLFNPNFVPKNKSVNLVTEHMLLLIKQNVCPDDSVVELMHSEYVKNLVPTSKYTAHDQVDYVFYRFHLSKGNYAMAKEFYNRMTAPKFGEDFPLLSADTAANIVKDASKLEAHDLEQLIDDSGLEQEAIKKLQPANLLLAIEHYAQSDKDEAKVRLEKWAQAADSDRQSVKLDEEQITILISLLDDLAIAIEQDILEKLKQFAKGNGDPYKKLLGAAKKALEARYGVKLKTQYDQDLQEAAAQGIYQDVANLKDDLKILIDNGNFDGIKGLLTSSAVKQELASGVDPVFLSYIDLLAGDQVIYDYILISCENATIKRDCRDRFDNIVQAVAGHLNVYDWDRLMEVIDFLEYPVTQLATGNTIPFKHDADDWVEGPKSFIYSLLGKLRAAIDDDDLSFFDVSQHEDNMKTTLRKLLTWNVAFTSNAKLPSGPPPIQKLVQDPYLPGVKKYAQLVIRLLQDYSCKDPEEKFAIDNSLFTFLTTALPGEQTRNVVEDICDGVPNLDPGESSSALFWRRYLRIQNNRAEQNDYNWFANDPSQGSKLGDQPDLEAVLGKFGLSDFRLFADTMRPTFNKLARLSAKLKAETYRRIAEDTNAANIKELLGLLNLIDPSDLAVIPCPDKIVKYLKLKCTPATFHEAICTEIFGILGPSCVEELTRPKLDMKAQLTPDLPNTGPSPTTFIPTIAQPQQRQPTLPIETHENRVIVESSTDQEISEPEEVLRRNNIESAQEQRVKMFKNVPKYLQTENLASKYQEIQVELARELIVHAETSDQTNLAIAFIVDCQDKLESDIFEEAFKKAISEDQFNELFKKSTFPQSYIGIGNIEIAINAFGTGPNQHNPNIAGYLRKAVEKKLLLTLKEFRLAISCLFVPDLSCPAPCIEHIESAKELTKKVLNSVTPMEETAEQIVTLAQGRASAIGWVSALVLAKQKAQDNVFDDMAYKAFVLAAMSNPQLPDIQRTAVQYVKQAGIAGRYGAIALLINIADNHISRIVEDNVPRSVYDEAVALITLGISDDLREVSLTMPVDTGPAGKESEFLQSADANIPKSMYANPDYFIDRTRSGNPVNHCSQLDIMNLTRLGRELQFSCISLVKPQVLRELGHMEDWWQFLDSNMFRYMDRTVLSYIDVKDFAQLPSELLAKLGENISVYSKDHPCVLLESKEYYTELGWKGKLETLPKHCILAMESVWYNGVQAQINHTVAQPAQAVLQSITLDKLTDRTKRSFRIMPLPAEAWKMLGTKVYSRRTHPCSAFTIEDAHRTPNFWEGITLECLASFDSSSKTLLERMESKELNLLPLQILETVPATQLRHLSLESISQLDFEAQQIIIDKLVDSGYLKPTPEMKTAFREIWDTVNNLLNGDLVDDQADGQSIAQPEE